MEHIINPESKGIDFDRYLAYLKTIQNKVPEHIYAFASDSRYFDFSSKTSLHDAWLESMTVRENTLGLRNEDRRLEIQLCLFGPYHDRHIHLKYSGVERYTFSTPSRHGEPRYTHTAHGDLLTHEIRLGENGLFVHEILFERGSTFLIEFADFSHHEETNNA
jgi:hypothetical protein